MSLVVLKNDSRGLVLMLSVSSVIWCQVQAGRFCGKCTFLSLFFLKETSQLQNTNNITGHLPKACQLSFPACSFNGPFLHLDAFSGK